MLDLLSELRMIGIIRLDDLSQAVEISSALLDAGVKIQEYTLSNPRALDAILQVREAIPEFRTDSALLGVGSVRSVPQAVQAVEAQVDFVVTPVMQEGVIHACHKAGVPTVCGALTPTEIVQARDAGATFVKVFPARIFGPKYIQDLLAPMPDLPLVPTGGVNCDNIPKYLEAGAIAVGVGGSLIDAAAIQARDWSALRATAAKYVKAAANQAE